MTLDDAMIAMKIEWRELEAVGVTAKSTPQEIADSLESLARASVKEGNLLRQKARGFRYVARQMRENQI